MFSQLQEQFQNKANAEQAKMLAGYMRDQFEFYGLHTPERRACYREFFKQEKGKQKIDWQLLIKAWQDEHREFQYFVCDYLIAMKKFLTYDDISKIEKFARSKQWWDTIDNLIKPIGYLGLHDKRIDELMLKWSVDQDFWIRRIAIEHQLLRKEKMNTKLLNQILVNNLNSEKFFINKAIGWALRDYSKTNPEWVRAFIAKNSPNMDKLSIKEGSKYLPN